MIDKIIESWLIQRGIKNYDLFAKSYSYSDWTSDLILGNGIAVVTNLILIGNIALVADIANNGLVLTSVNERVDYSNLMKFTELTNGIVVAESNFISLHTTKIKINLPTPQIFNSIIKGSFTYYNIQSK